jgi:hypothetical protein
MMFMAVKERNKDVLGIYGFMDAVKAKGYNAVIDFNDAGTLSKTPIRIIDSSSFEIEKSEVLTPEEILQSAKSWKPSLVHVEVSDDFLLHAIIDQPMRVVVDDPMNIWHFQRLSNTIDSSCRIADGDNQ